MSSLIRHFLIIIACFTLTIACSSNDDGDNEPSNPPDSSNPSDSTGNSEPSGPQMPSERPSDINITMHGTKIEQIVGDYDKEEEKATRNKTESKYQLAETDLGVPFRYKDKTYVLFGDTHGGIEGDRDAMAYTADSDIDDGVDLTFLHDSDDLWQPIEIPDISQGAFEVPLDGFEKDDKMYLYFTTDHSEAKTMGRSILARSEDEGSSFDLLYTVSDSHFINVSIVKTKAANLEFIPEDEGEVLVIFGSGDYRNSNVYLAYQPVSDIEDHNSIRFFAGIDEDGEPVWKSSEQNTVALFDQPQVGELSVTYNSFIKRWILLYNAMDPRGINLRTSQNPWGSWTKPTVIFDPDSDEGYGNFMHLPNTGDGLSDPGREDEAGGEYGPYQYGHFAKGDSTATKPSTTIYFNMSTWNPYTVVLMKAELEKK